MTDEQRDCWAATGSCTRTGKISTIIGLRIGAGGYNVCMLGKRSRPPVVLGLTHFPAAIKESSIYCSKIITGENSVHLIPIPPQLQN